MTPENKPADWFRAEIVDGLKSLIALRLDGHPSADSVAATGAAWIDTLWARGGWEQCRDIPRLRAAFTSLLRDARRWPAPADLRDRLPVLVNPYKLEAPEIDAAGQQRIRNELGRLKTLLGGGM